MTGIFNSSKLVDGYALNVADGYSYTTQWVDIHSAPLYSVTVVFTGGSPVGTVKLQQSNDRQYTGGNLVQPLVAAGAENSSGTTKVISDVADVPTGTGTNSVSVSGAGAYVLNQFWVPYHWFRVVYTASSNANTQLDIFVSFKG